MVWLELSIALFAGAASFFGVSFLSSAWIRQKKASPETLRLESMLPGYDCGLCGESDCRSYAAAIDLGGADPALCSPGGFRLESRLRSYFSGREGDPRGLALRAVVRCGGREGLAAMDFHYDGFLDCRSAIRWHGGPKRCKDGCAGFGSCATACHLGAIGIVSRLAVINPAICTGCGDCLKICPNGIISLVPRDQAWYVSCSSMREPELRKSDCAAACVACGECASSSGRSEFQIEHRLARENPEATGGRWSAIAERCPTGAIVFAGAEKKRRSPFRQNAR